MPERELMSEIPDRTQPAPRLKPQAKLVPQIQVQLRANLGDSISTVELQLNSIHPLILLALLADDSLASATNNNYQLVSSTCYLLISIIGFNSPAHHPLLAVVFSFEVKPILSLLCIASFVY